MRRLIFAAAAASVAGCAATSQQGTLAELEAVPADVDEVYLADSLERAAQSYRRYLAETAESERTPEAMRRLADLQIEKQFGIQAGDGKPREMAAPEAARAPEAIAPGLALHHKPVIDTLYLSPLAFPENPCSRSSTDLREAFSRL